MNTQINYHYYGDTVRILFIIAGLIMILSYPFFATLITAPVLIAIVSCLALAIFGGLTNPKQRWIMFVNTVISIIAFIVFEYSAVSAYIHVSQGESVQVGFFWFNQMLTLIFFFAAYLSTKTLRGFFIAE